MAAPIVIRGAMQDAEKDAKYAEFAWSLVVPASEVDRMEVGPWLGVAVPLGGARRLSLVGGGHRAYKESLQGLVEKAASRARGEGAGAHLYQNIDTVARDFVVVAPNALRVGAVVRLRGLGPSTLVAISLDEVVVEAASDGGTALQVPLPNGLMGLFSMFDPEWIGQQMRAAVSALYDELGPSVSQRTLGGVGGGGGEDASGASAEGEACGSGSVAGGSGSEATAVQRSRPRRAKYEDAQLVDLTEESLVWEVAESFVVQMEIDRLFGSRSRAPREAPLLAVAALFAEVFPTQCGPASETVRVLAEGARGDARRQVRAVPPASVAAAVAVWRAAVEVAWSSADSRAAAIKRATLPDEAVEGDVASPAKMARAGDMSDARDFVFSPPAAAAPAPAAAARGRGRGRGRGKERVGPLQFDAAATPPAEVPADLPALRAGAIVWWECCGEGALVRVMDVHHNRYDPPSYTVAWAEPQPAEWGRELRTTREFLFEQAPHRRAEEAMVRWMNAQPGLAQRLATPQFASPATRGAGGQMFTPTPPGGSDDGSLAGRASEWRVASDSRSCTPPGGAPPNPPYQALPGMPQFLRGGGAAMSPSEAPPPPALPPLPPLPPLTPFAQVLPPPGAGCVHYGAPAAPMGAMPAWVQASPGAPSPGWWSPPGAPRGAPTSPQARRTALPRAASRQRWRRRREALAPLSGWAVCLFGE